MVAAELVPVVALAATQEEEERMAARRVEVKVARETGTMEMEGQAAQKEALVVVGPGVGY